MTSSSGESRITNHESQERDRATARRRDSDVLHEECGVIGIVSGDGPAAPMAHLGLYALQHRGQESAGIATSDGVRLWHHRGMGLVFQVFDADRIARLPGPLAIGHVRYSTMGSVRLENAQPLVVPSPWGPLALAHNGNLINAPQLRAELETGAFDHLGAVPVRDVDPGELVILDAGGLRSIQVLPPGRVAHCVFEYIYFARPDTVLADRNVHLARRRMGRILAREHPAQGDVVIPVPDSGASAAMGFAEASGIPLEVGLVKNRYIGRTFIQPDPAMRDFGVRVKLNPLRDVLDGRRVVMVDDSVVRGTTSGKIVRMLRAAGATEVHVRISSPPIRYPCFYGIDTSSRGQLVAATQSVENIRELLAADSLGYLSQAGLVEALQLAPERLCMACLDGHYPTRVPLESLAGRHALEPVADRPPEPALQGGRDE